MVGARSEPGQASPRRMRLRLVWVAVGLVVALVVALSLVDRQALHPDDAESAGTPVPSRVPLPVLESGTATFAEIASIEDAFTRNAALYAFIRDAPRARLEEWLGEVETLPASLHRSDVARVLYIRFAVLDPQAALRHALRGTTRASWLAAIFRTWGQDDADAAAARAGALHPTANAVASRALLELDLPRDELRSIVARLDENRPNREMQRRVQLATGTPLVTRSEYLLAEIEARSHARREGESHADAWDRAISVEDALVRRILVDQLTIDWARRDPGAAMAAVEAWDTDDEYQPFVTGGGFAPSMPIRQFLKSRIIGQWAQNDAQAALRWALGRDRADMLRFATVVLSVLAEHAPAEAISRLADLPDEVRARASGGVLWTLARTDLDRAMDLFASLSIEQQTGNAMALRQSLISQRSPQSALDWALSLDRRIRAREVSSVIGDASHRDLDEALRLLDSIEDPAIRAAAAPGLVPQQVQNDAKEALAWARNFRPEAQRDRLVVQVFNAWAATDPGGACRELFETRGGSTRDRAAAGMMARVVGHDVALAERLFDSIGTPEQRAVAAEILYRYFTDIDPRQRKAERYRKFLPEDDDESDEEEDS